MTEEAIIGEYGNPSRLMESIREGADLEIQSIKEKTENEILKAEKDFADEMKSYNDARKRETDAEIGNTIYIMRNRAAIEKRKLQLNEVENFIQVAVKETVGDYIADNPTGYTAFLKKLIIDVLSGIKAKDVMVHLGPGDAAVENYIRDFIASNNVFEGTVNFIIDDTITMGGMIMENMADGIVYNYSMERYISRKYDTIRKEVAGIVQKHVQSER